MASIRFALASIRASKSLPLSKKMHVDLMFIELALLNKAIVLKIDAIANKFSNVEVSYE